MLDFDKDGQFGALEEWGPYAAHKKSGEHQLSYESSREIGTDRSPSPFWPQATANTAQALSEPSPKISLV